MAAKKRPNGSAAKASTPARSTPVKAAAMKTTPVRNTPIPRVAAKKPAAAKQSAATEVTPEMIARRAYEIWQSGQGGSECENWLRAERELRG